MSRSRPEIFRQSVGSVLGNALHRNQIEIICRLDCDDPMLRHYFEIQEDNLKFIVGTRGNGYFDFGAMIDDCAKLSTGDLLWQWGDDAIMKTNQFDRIIEEKIVTYGKQWFVASSTLTSDRPAGDYKYGFFAIPKFLVWLFSAPNTMNFSHSQSFGYDRVYDAFATHGKCELQSGIAIHHAHLPDLTTEQGISKVEKVLEKSFGEKMAEWDDIGKEMATACGGL
jgi:hypothetical protein